MAAITQRTLAGINPNLTIVKFQTFDGQIAGQFTEERMIARLTALFGALALLLTGVGLYRRHRLRRRPPHRRNRHPHGARRQPYANPTGIIAMVMREALIHIGIGLAIGIATALLSVPFVESQPYEIKGIDAGVLLAATFTLTAAACIAGMIPARRAPSTDPARATANGVTGRPWPSNPPPPPSDEPSDSMPSNALSDLAKYGQNARRGVDYPNLTGSKTHPILLGER
jgi:macrolide transport system ATP-binding/permease protein